MAFAGTLCRLKQSRLTKIKKKRAGLGYKTILIIFHDNNEEFMTFIFNNVFFLFVFHYLDNATSAASHTAEKQMLVVDVCFWPLPFTTTQNGGVELTQENERFDWPNQARGQRV